MYRYVLFDLDGTLTDPKEGICKSVQYALHAMNIEEPNLDKLECFIGPPLKDSYMEFYGMAEEQADEGVKKYRERYSTIGLFENEVYPGMKELLAGLKEQGIHMAVASSKPKPFVERIMERFELAEYFEVVIGSELSGKKVEKIDVMREALSALFHISEDKVPELNAEESLEEQLKKAKRIIPLDDVLMVGDRKFDIEGAKHFMIDSIAVSYGYAPDGELTAAKATYITDDLDEVYEIVTGSKPKRAENQKNALQKSYHVLLPLVYDFVFTYAILFLLQFGLDFLLTNLLKGKGAWFAANSSPVAVGFDAIASSVCAVIFFFLYKKEKKVPISKIVERKIHKVLKRDCLLIAGFGVFLALFLNVVLSGLQIIGASDAYKEVANVQYSVSIGYGLLIYGIIKPIEEELIFRGLVYGRMRRYYPLVFCAPVSALIFGASHGNLVQLLYGFLMGCILAVLFERYRSLKANILFHSAANIAVYLVSVIAVLNNALFGIAGIVVCGILAIVFGFFLGKQMQKKID